LNIAHRARSAGLLHHPPHTAHRNSGKSAACFFLFPGVRVPQDPPVVASCSSNDATLLQVFVSKSLRTAYHKRLNPAQNRARLRPNRPRGPAFWGSRDRV
jgi:hypothetical protein